MDTKPKSFHVGQYFNLRKPIQGLSWKEGQSIKQSQAIDMINCAKMLFMEKISCRKT